ncbi:mannitol dehydrogenase family protein [Sanguibacter inulinus]|uniref:Mannitol-1-phosphate 5-dehydrogenase n=1 Tax=Sanguibacter inulinus TaxID=60922 RepID=A0A853EZW8_9MICO|nr:mannitol dehydrogenase family protein [Sanguibacter inulinus]MBF0723203.1 mannitol dehydrogenase family protein [Sanguibacter inulinus]NYS94348.1 mannitol dehydrogenase family protein [Sanguibacter inulinus]
MTSTDPIDRTPTTPRASRRLSLDTCREVSQRPGVTGPAVDPRAVTVGIVHLGIGAFHRAHQAVFTEDAAAATGETRWGILGVTQRSATVVEQLVPQDGLYGVRTVGTDSSSLRVIGSVRGVAYPREETQRVLDAIAAPTTHVVTLTVTEKGYTAGPDGRLDLSDGDVRGDLDALVGEIRGAAALARQTGTEVQGAATTHVVVEDAVPARSAIGLLVRGLAARARAGGEPLTVLTCDNLLDNGHVLEGLVGQALDAAAGVTGADPEQVERLRAWVHASVTFPCTMVDRIVPATTEDDRAAAEAATGVRDEGLVVAEPFMQWVIEDRFAGPRPAWELAGATLTDDVAPFERAKLRMLNGTHSLLAYLGSIAGHRLIADAVADPALLSAARSLLLDDVIPTLVAPEGLDLAAYAESLLERFANPALGHTTTQVAMDGSKKLPIRFLATAADRLAAGAVPDAVAQGVAGWVVFVAAGRTVTGEPLRLDDPIADELRAAAAEVAAPDEVAPAHAEALVRRMLAVEQVFPAEIRDHAGFRDAVVAHAERLLAGYAQH